MNVTGSMIQEALVLQVRRKDFATKQFKDSVWQFPTDSGGHEVDMMAVFNELQKAEDTIARLQVMQDTYNMAVTVTPVPDKPMRLALAIKKFGALSRLAKAWKEAAESSGVSRYGSLEMTKKADDIVRQRAIPVAKCREHEEACQALLSKYRLAIKAANQTEIAMGDADPQWFA
jgi:hypothetical protein